MSNQFKLTILLIISLFLGSCSTATVQPDIKPVSTTAQETTSQGSSSSIVSLNFTVSGGPIEFCDELTVNEVGEFKLVQPCKENELTGILVGSDLESFQNWTQELASFQLTRTNEADGITSKLVFQGKGTGASDEHKTAIFDWVSGLIIRMQPPPTPPLPPNPVEVGTEGLCPNINRPAMLVDSYDSPYQIIAIDPVSQESCDIVLKSPPLGPIVGAGGNLYYPVFDEDAKTMTVWQLSLDGSQVPLEFTSVTIDEPFFPFNFTLSTDGKKIAWTRAIIDIGPDSSQLPPYRNDLWVANIDGSEKVTLLDKAENNQELYVIPIRFSPDYSEFYYALQPNRPNGLGMNFSGRYDSVYSLSTTGGQPQLIYACSKDTVQLCIGDISPDGNSLAYIDPEANAVQVIRRDGELINRFVAPGEHYIGQPTFGPNGNLAFVSTTFDEKAKEFPLPIIQGYISFVPPPYTASPQTLVEDNMVATVWEWLDETNLAYGIKTEDTFSVGVAVVSIDGQTTKLSPNFPLGVWR